MSDDFGRILETLTRLEQGQEQLKQELRQDHERLRVDLMGRMERLQDSLTTIRDDIATNYGTADVARQANDNTREELRALNDVVMRMQRQMARLQTDVRTLKGEQ